MIHRIFIFQLILMWLPDLYIYYQVLKPRFSRFRWICWLHWLPSIVLTLSLSYLMFGDNFTSMRVKFTAALMVAFLTFIVPKCLFVLVSLFGRFLNLISRFSLCKILTKFRINTMFDLLGCFVACFGAYIILYGSVWGWHRFEVKEIPFFHPDVPESFDGYRIVQISDFHIGTIASYPDVVHRAVEIINTQHPDLIVFTGDLVNNEASELNGLENILSDLHAKDGVFSVLGNHDYGLYRRWPDKQAHANNLVDLKQRQLRMGWNLLLNTNKIISRGKDSIAVVGVENDGKPPFPALGDLPRALQGTDGMFKVLLSHDPSHWRRKVIPETDIQLMLAGHTHGMQFRLGDFSPSAWIYPEWGGLYTQGNQNLYVSVGLGSVMIPFRYGAWPEISVITLRRKSYDESNNKDITVINE